MQAAHIDRVLDLNPEKVKQCMDAGLLQYRKKANEIVARLMAKDDERTVAYREYEQGSILLAPLYAVGKGAALTQESPIS